MNESSQAKGQSPIGNGSKCRHLNDDGIRCETNITPQADTLYLLCDAHSAKITDMDVAVYTSVVRHFEQDLREFFTRSNFYLVAVVALLAAFVSRENLDDRVSILIATVGFVLSLFWPCVAFSTVCWIGRWRKQAARVSKALDRRFEAYFEVEKLHLSGSLWKKLFSSPEHAKACLPGVFCRRLVLYDSPCSKTITNMSRSVVLNGMVSIKASLGAILWPSAASQ